MNKSSKLFQEAQRYLIGGVNSPVRAFKAVGGTPIFFKQGKDCHLIDVDEHVYIDYVNSWGALILGHCPPSVVKAVTQMVQKAMSFGAPCEVEIQLAAAINKLMPNLEKIRMVNSGTEATMTAVRLARGVTGRNKIIKFAGCYHGHTDALLVQAGSGALTLGVPSSPGVPPGSASDTLVADFNDVSSVERLFETHGKEIAAIIVEPVAGNMGCVLPQAGFLQALRSLCDHYQSLLIFDEVITGFRVGLQGAQGYFQVKPDLTTLGKIIGGGLPVGAVGGSADVMEYLAPVGAVYQAGTLAGNPVAMAAGLATLQAITEANFYDKINGFTQQLTNGIKACAQAANIPLVIQRIGSMFSLFFTEQAHINSLKQVEKINSTRYQRYFHAMLKEGFYFPPSPFECCFISNAHTTKAITASLDAFQTVFKNLG